jgi:hypothetical protein
MHVSKLPRIPALGLLLGCATAAVVPFAASGRPDTDARLVRSAQIVGVWEGTAFVSPCGTPPPAQGFRTLSVFHAGGTAGASNSLPSASLTPAYGNWSYQPRTRTYEAQLQFYWFNASGAYDGYQRLERRITLSADRQRIDEEIRATRYAASGAVAVQLCGVATATRIE